MSVTCHFHGKGNLFDAKRCKAIQPLLTGHFAERGVENGELHITGSTKWLDKGTPHNQGVQTKEVLKNGVRTHIHAGSNTNSMNVILRFVIDGEAMPSLDLKELLDAPPLPKEEKVDPPPEFPKAPPLDVPPSSPAAPEDVPSPDSGDTDDGENEEGKKEPQNEEEKIVSPDPEHTFHNFMRDEAKIAEVLDGVKDWEIIPSYKLNEVIREVYGYGMNPLQAGQWIVTVGRHGFLNRLRARHYVLTQTGKDLLARQQEHLASLHTDPVSEPVHAGGETVSELLERLKLAIAAETHQNDQELSELESRLPGLLSARDAAKSLLDEAQAELDAVTSRLDVLREEKERHQDERAKQIREALGLQA